MLNKLWHYIAIIIVMVSIIVILNGKQNEQNELEYFLVKNDPDNDGKMRFGYLTNPNYANTILSRYYINDDRKIGGVRMVSHPYRFRYSPNGRDRYYGNLFWNKTLSDNVYKNTGIRL
jgi:hypothetical protein